MDKGIQIVIADDNLFFAEALGEILEIQNGFSIKKVVSNLDDLILFCDTNKFDVLVLDINFNGDSSLNYIDQIRKDISSFKIIILSSLDDDYNKGRAEKYGIELFVSKENTFKGFHEIIRECHEKEDFKKQLKTSGAINIDGVKFTETKIRVLKSLYKHSGKKESEIAELLHISESSLKTHKRQLYEMTDTKRIADLIKFGFENGILLQ